MLPQKLFFRIGEVAGLVGVEPHVLRYWEREFRSIRPTKSAKGQRVYSRKDVENLLRVRDLLYRDGFTIAGAKKKLQRGDETNGEPDSERATARALIEDGQLQSQPAESSTSASSSSLPTSTSTARAVDEPRSNQPGELAPSSVSVQQDHVREKLLALRSEVEAFLTELSTSPQPRADSRR